MSGRETILIVDDMEINRAVLCETFKDSCRIMEAENGKQATAWNIFCQCRSK